MAKKVGTRKDPARKARRELRREQRKEPTRQPSPAKYMLDAYRQAIFPAVAQYLDGATFDVTLSLQPDSPPVTVPITLRLLGDIVRREDWEPQQVFDAVFPAGHIEYVIEQSGWGLALQGSADE